MSLLKSYFEDGLSVEDLAKKEDTTAEAIIAKLRAAGLTISTGALYDLATSAIINKGFGSFLGYIQKSGLKSTEDQARELGVTRGTLTRTYDTFRNYRTRSSGRNARCDSGEDSEA